MLDTAALTELTDAHLVNPSQATIVFIRERPADENHSILTVLIDR